jgi:hypothetical protein
MRIAFAFAAPRVFNQYQRFGCDNVFMDVVRMSTGTDVDFGQHIAVRSHSSDPKRLRTARRVASTIDGSGCGRVVVARSPRQRSTTGQSA